MRSRELPVRRDQVANTDPNAQPAASARALEARRSAACAPAAQRVVDGVSPLRAAEDREPATANQRLTPIVWRHAFATSPRQERCSSRATGDCTNANGFVPISALPHVPTSLTRCSCVGPNGLGVCVSEALAPTSVRSGIEVSAPERRHSCRNPQELTSAEVVDIVVGMNTGHVGAHARSSTPRAPAVPVEGTRLSGR